MAGVAGKSGRKPKPDAVRTGIIVDQKTYDYLSRTGNASREIEKMVEARQKTWDITLTAWHEEYMDYVNQIHPMALDHLAEAIHVRRLALMQSELERSGIHSSYKHGDVTFRYLLVYAPNGDLPNEWADLGEARRLLDTVKNLPPAEAFARWREKVQPIPPAPYSQEQAARDTIDFRASARQRYQDGEISAEDLRLDIEISRSFRDLAD